MVCFTNIFVYYISQGSPEIFNRFQDFQSSQQKVLFIYIKAFILGHGLTQLCSVAQLCPTLCDPMDCSTPGFLSFTSGWSLLKLISIELVMPFNYLTLSCPLLLLPSVLSGIRVFSKESALPIRWSMYWSFSFSIILPMNIQGWFLLRLVWSPCSPRDSQESSPAPHSCGGWQIQMHRAGWQPGNSGRPGCLSQFFFSRKSQFYS